jgi:hypothetical protein
MAFEVSLFHVSLVNRQNTYHDGLIALSNPNLTQMHKLPDGMYTSTNICT